MPLAELAAVSTPLPASADQADGEAARVRRAARATRPEMLSALADDQAVTVRAAVALNPAFAEAANLRLVRDSDARVRMLLAGKVARLLPGLSGREHAAAQAHVHHMLMTLADDAAVRVRVAISDALTTMSDAPRDVILKLAQDPAVAVSDQVVRLSPLLTDADLLGLLATPPHAGTATAVASRAGLSAQVVNNIAVHAGSGAVCALLLNPSATIQEATLDALVGRSEGHPDWHEPLVRRPWLSLTAVRTLSRFVAAHLFDTLVNRSDLTPALAEELRGRIVQSLSDAPRPTSNDDAILDNVRRLHDAGQLTEAKLLEMVAAGESRMVAAILAVASGVTLAVIDRATTLRSAKGLVSLAYRAGFTMHAGSLVQAALGGLGPAEMLVPTPDGGFPLSASEMDWQIELLGEPGH